jgi:hypothetical protein
MKAGHDLDLLGAGGALHQRKDEESGNCNQ